MSLCITKYLLQEETSFIKVESRKIDHYRYEYLDSRLTISSLIKQFLSLDIYFETLVCERHEFLSMEHGSNPMKSGGLCQFTVVPVLHTHFAQ